MKCIDRNLNDREFWAAVSSDIHKIQSEICRRYEFADTGSCGCLSVDVIMNFLLDVGADCSMLAAGRIPKGGNS